MLRTVASTTIWPRDYPEVDVPKSILDHDGLLAVESNLSESFGVPSILHSVVKKICIENTGCKRVSLRKHEHFCKVRPVYVPLTDPEPSHTDTKNTLRTHVKLSNSYSSQVTIDPDYILTRETVPAIKDSFARNDTVFSPVSQGYKGQAGPFQAQVNIGPVMPPRERGGYLKILVDSWSYFKPSSMNSNPWAYSRGPKMLKSQLSTSTHHLWLRNAPVDSAL